MHILEANKQYFPSTTAKVKPITEWSMLEKQIGEYDDENIVDSAKTIAQIQSDNTTVQPIKIPTNIQSAMSRNYKNIQTNDKLENAKRQKGRVTVSPLTSMRFGGISGAQAYHAGMLGLDAAAMFSNMLQQPPTPISTQKTYFQKYDLDNTQFRTQEAELDENLNRAYRQAREGAGQQSDLARLVSGVSVMGQEASRKIGAAERAQLNKERMLNQELTNKGIALRDQQLDREMMLNRARMEKHAQQKGMALGKNIDAIKSDLANMADYEAKSKYIDQLNENTQKQNEIGYLATLYTMTQDIEDTAEYKKQLSAYKTGLIGAKTLELQEKFGLTETPSTEEYKADKLKYDNLFSDWQDDLVKLGDRPLEEELEDPITTLDPKPEITYETAPDISNFGDGTIDLSQPPLEEQAEALKEYEEALDTWEKENMKTDEDYTKYEDQQKALKKWEESQSDEEYIKKVKEYNKKKKEQEDRIKTYDLNMTEIDKRREKLDEEKVDIEKRGMYIKEYEDFLLNDEELRNANAYITKQLGGVSMQEIRDRFKAIYDGLYD